MTTGKRPQDSYDGDDLSYRVDKDNVANLSAHWLSELPSPSSMPPSYDGISPLSSSSTGIYTPSSNEGWNHFEDSFSHALVSPRYNVGSRLPNISPCIIPSSSEYSWSTSDTHQLAPKPVLPTTPAPQTNDCVASPRDIQQISHHPWSWQPSTMPPPQIFMPHSTASILVSPSNSMNEGVKNWDQSYPMIRVSNESNMAHGKDGVNSAPRAQVAPRQRARRSSRDTPSANTMHTASKCRTLNSSRRLSTTSSISRSPTTPDPEALEKAKSHNEVEKQYRQRLNGHFAALLSKIPKEVVDANGIDTIAGMTARNISKAETLVLAGQYIKILQDGEKKLVEKNRKLEADLGRLKTEWVKRGGIPMP